MLNYPEYALPFGVCVGRFSRPCEDWYDSLSCEDILVWRDFFVAKCNLWIHYTTHTFWVTAGCLIIVQALVATLGYKKKLGPDPFHNKYMCSCCCCCCSTTRLAGEMLFFQGAARNILNLSAQSTRNHLFFFHGLDGLCCCSMQVDNATNTFMLILLFWRLKVHCVVLGRLCFCMTKQTLFSWVNRLNKTDWPWRKTQFHTVTLKVDRWQGPPFTNVVLGILFSSQISLFIQLQKEKMYISDVVFPDWSKFEFLLRLHGAPLSNNCSYSGKFTEWLNVRLTSLRWEYDAAVFWMITFTFYVITLTFFSREDFLMSFSLLLVHVGLHLWIDLISFSPVQSYLSASFIVKCSCV